MSIDTEFVKTIESFGDDIKYAKNSLHPQIDQGGVSMTLGEMFTGERSDWYAPQLKVDVNNIALFAHRIQENRVDQSMLLEIGFDTENGMNALCISSSYIFQMYGVPLVMYYPKSDNISQRLNVYAREMNAESVYNQVNMGNIVSEITGDMEIVSVLRSLHDVYV